MSEYRLHIDIPLGGDEEKAINKAKNLVQEFFEDNINFSSGSGTVHILKEKYNIDQINYRLGYDEDRQKSNYLNKNENGHVTNKKIKMSISG